MYKFEVNPANNTKRSVGIVGKGNLAARLGPAWARCGHKVTYGVRDPTHPDVSELIHITGNNSKAVFVSELSSLVDVILLSVRWDDIDNVLNALGGVKGKILIDCITPMTSDKKTLVLGRFDSAAEHIAAYAQDALVVKAFDTVGVRTIDNPLYNNDAATVFICGDDVPSKHIVSGLAIDLGFDVCDVGGLHCAKYIESLGMLWVQLAFFGGYGKDIAFKFLLRDSI